MLPGQSNKVKVYVSSVGSPCIEFKISSIKYQSCEIKHDVSSFRYQVSNKYKIISIRQAGAELGQAQLRLELELIVFVEYTNLPFNAILIWLQIAELAAGMGS